MSGFFCPRCGTLWGWITVAPGSEARRAMMQECVEGRCFPLREVFVNLGDWLRLHPGAVPDQERVERAIESAATRWNELARKWTSEP